MRAAATPTGPAPTTMALGLGVAADSERALLVAVREMKDAKRRPNRVALLDTRSLWREVMVCIRCEDVFDRQLRSMRMRWFTDCSEESTKRGEISLIYIF